MTLEDERVELPFDATDQLAEAARWFSETPDDMNAWRALVDAVETARPTHTDPLDEAVRVIANFREEKADPRTVAQAFLDLDVRLRAGKAPGGRKPRKSQSAGRRLAYKRLAAVGSGRTARRRRRTG